jgi:hypothetical protein
MIFNILIWLLIGGFFGGVFWAAKYEEYNAMPSSRNELHPTSILFFYCLIITIVWPLFVVAVLGYWVSKIFSTLIQDVVGKEE